MNAEFTAHFFFTMLPYKMTSPGTLCIPTRVAAVSCHALSPLFNQGGLASSGCRFGGSDILMFSTSGEILNERNDDVGDYIAKLRGRRGFRTCCNMPRFCHFLVNWWFGMNTSWLWLWNLWFPLEFYCFGEVGFCHLGEENLNWRWRCAENPIACLSTGIVVKKMVTFIGFWLILTKEELSNDWDNLRLLMSQIQESALLMDMIGEAFMWKTDQSLLKRIYFSYVKTGLTWQWEILSGKMFIYLIWRWKLIRWVIH